VPVQHLPTSQAAVKTAQFGDVYVVTAEGELDVSGAGPLRRELDRVHERGGRRIIVDLLGVSFLDSAALGVLVGSAKRARASGGRFSLVSDDPRALRVFQITGLDRVFSLERSLAAAIDL
jgi:anti-sigma B factor antagonist